MAESVKIIENGYLITCDRQRSMGWFSLLVKDDRIAELSNTADGFKARFPNAEIIDASEKILLPGFLDPHYHGESFVLRHWTAGIMMSRWNKDYGARKVLKFFHTEADKELLVAAYRVAYFAALKSGITFLSEFGFDNLDSPYVAAKEAMKRSDLKGMVGVHNGEQLEAAKTSGPGPIRSGLVLPSEDDLTTYNLQTTIRNVHELQWPVIVHLGETKRGLETVRRNFHRSPARVLEEYKLLSLPLHLLHNAHMDEGDESLLARAQRPLVINAASILSKSADVPPLKRLMDAGNTFALCSDWGTPDPFENMRALQNLAIIAGIDPFDPRELLAAHTIYAAQSLGVQDETGSIEPGKRADIAFLDVSDLRMQLAYQRSYPQVLLSNLIAQAGSSMVSDVMINGEFFLRKKQVMTYSEEDLKGEYRSLLGRLAELAGVSPVPAPQAAAPSTPILPLAPANSPGQEEQEPNNLMDEPSDEGFRILGTNKPSPPPPPPPQEEKEKDRELPKTVRRVFGEDEP